VKAAASTAKGRMTFFMVLDDGRRDPRLPRTGEEAKSKAVTFLSQPARTMGSPGPDGTGGRGLQRERRTA
jgi:hypothetical protein